MFPEITKSNKMKERAKKVIPHITGTFSRSPSHFVENVFPVYAQSGKGSHIIDLDGNEFLDYYCGLGPITLGYNYKVVNDAIVNQLKKGILFSIPHPIEVEVSELISNIIPNAEMVKLEKSGSNAVTGAVRAARYITKRDKVAYCGSGGVWHDWQAVMVSRDGGVPKFNKELIKVFEYNDSEGLEQIFEDNPNQIAAIVLEPTVYEKPQDNFLQKVRKIANDNDSLLILDEIVSGFRFDLGGCQKFFNIKGDMVCFGKGMGNGLAISAITGGEEFMKTFDDLWVSSTNNAETLSMAGTVAVINEMKEKNTIRQCWSTGKKLFDEWNKITESHGLSVKMNGYPIRMKLDCYDSKENENEYLKSLVLQEMIKKGIFFSPGVSFISYSHTSEDIELTLNALEDICKEIKKNVIDDKYEKLLKGDIPKTIWSMKIPPTTKNTC
jgi:glutamate-1-semialdehyde aminotransferase